MLLAESVKDVGQSVGNTYWSGRNERGREGAGWEGAAGRAETANFVTARRGAWLTGKVKISWWGP
eukprot:COSAG02_NODE_1168_length_14134_cov_19.590310_12_plen_65_part_00